MNIKPLVTVVRFAGVALSALSSDQGVSIEIERKHSDSKSTLGYLSINGNPICYVMEKPWRGNYPFMSSIPKGTYEAKIRKDGSLGWRIQLEGVPQREEIQIHVGNKQDDSVGCLLPGLSVSEDFTEVHESRKAIGKIRETLDAIVEDPRRASPLP
ncbi:MAG: DUF5675 family protein [Verrucomicrobiales bacterium]